MTSPFQTKIELEKEIEHYKEAIINCDIAEVAHDGWDRSLIEAEAKLSYVNAFLEEIDKRIIEIKKENMTARRKESGTFQYVRNKAIRELEALKNSVQGGEK